MPALSPERALRWGVRLLLGLLVLLALRAITPSGGDDNPAYDALVRAHTRKMATDSVALDSARQALRQSSARTLTSVTRYLRFRDTVNIHDTTQIKVFVERADSVVKSCSELAESCDRFRVRADSVIAGLRLDRERLRLQLDQSRPSTLDLFVRRTLPVVGFVAGVWVGSKVSR